MRELQLLLKRVVRAMSFAAYREHSLPLFDDLHIFTMTNINKYISSLFVYKALGKENQMFDIVANANYNVRSNHQMLLQVPNIRTAHSRQGVEWRGLEIWNALPAEIRMSTAYDSFKCRTKRFLLEEQAVST